MKEKEGELDYAMKWRSKMDGWVGNVRGASALGAKIGRLGAMTKIDTWLIGSKNGCLEAPIACLGLKTSGLPSMKND
jgi:hypothetical protein